MVSESLLFAMGIRSVCYDLFLSNQSIRFDEDLDVCLNPLSAIRRIIQLSIIKLGSIRFLKAYETPTGLPNEIREKGENVTLLEGNRWICP